MRPLMPYMNIAKGTTRTQRIEYIDSINAFSSNNKLWNLYHTSAWFFFGKGRDIDKTTLTNLCNNFNKHMSQLWKNSCNNLETYMYQFRQIHVTTQGNPYINFDKSMQQLSEIHISIQTNPCNKCNKLGKSLNNFWQIHAT